VKKILDVCEDVGKILTQHSKLYLKVYLAQKLQIFDEELKKSSGLAVTKQSGITSINSGLN